MSDIIDEVIFIGLGCFGIFVDIYVANAITILSIISVCMILIGIRWIIVNARKQS